MVFGRKSEELLVIPLCRCETMAVGKIDRNPLDQAIGDEESVSCCNCAELEADLEIEAGLAF